MMSIHWAYAPFALFLLAAAPLLADAILPAEEAEASAEQPRMRGHVMRPSDKAPVFVNGCEAADPGCAQADEKP